LYIGGSLLKNDYSQQDPRTSFKFQTQRRDVKSAQIVEQSLIAARDSTTVIKFAGNIDTKARANQLCKLNKESFIRTIRALSREHGHETFYAIRDDNGNVVDLLQNLPNFNLTKVLAEFTRRIDPTNTAIEAFDETELADLQLSRLVVRSRITAKFARKVKVQYGVNNSDFESYSGTVYLMQVLETCCGTCVCRATQKKGFWNLSHNTSKHKADWKPAKSAGNHVNASPAGSLPADGWHLSGVWCAPIADINPGVWCACSDYHVPSPVTTIAVRPVEREKSAEVHQDKDDTITPLVHRSNAWIDTCHLVLTFLFLTIHRIIFAPPTIASATVRALTDGPQIFWKHLFFYSALIWDTVAYFFAAPTVTKVPRRYRRSRNKFVRAIVASPLFFWSLAISPQPVMLPKGAHILLSEVAASWLTVDNAVQLAAGPRPRPLALWRDAQPRPITASAPWTNSSSSAPLPFGSINSSIGVSIILSPQPRMTSTMSNTSIPSKKKKNVVTVFWTECSTSMRNCPP
jgi:hypothetical protein